MVPLCSYNDNVMAFIISQSIYMMINRGISSLVEGCFRGCFLPRADAEFADEVEQGVHHGVAHNEVEQ